MNSTSTLFVISWFLVFTQSSIYNIRINTIDGNSISLAAYEGKKIIVTEFDALNPDLAELQYLDSLQSADTSIVLIAVPANDFSGTNSIESLQSLRNSLNLRMIITLPSGVKKVNGDNQNALFKWLTKAGNNDHFDEDVEEPGLIFIISTNGILYSQLKKATPHEVIENSINQQITQ
jgi:glutathione peroxidase